MIVAPSWRDIERYASPPMAVGPWMPPGGVVYPNPGSSLWPSANVWHWSYASAGVSNAGTSSMVWADQSGNGRNWTYGDSLEGQNPTGLAVVSANKINGLPVIDSYNVTHPGQCGMTITTNLTAESPSIFAQGMWMIVIGDPATNANNSVIHTLHNNYGFMVIANPTLTTGGSGYGFEMDASDRATLHAGNTGDGLPHILTCLYNWSTPGPANGSGTGTRYFYIDGVLQGAANSSNTDISLTSVEQPHILSYNATGSNGWAGYIAEIIIQTNCIGNMTNQQFVNQHRYLGQKYGITVP